jgi:hypothetical protein
MKRSKRSPKAREAVIPISPPLAIRTEKIDQRGWLSVGAQTDRGSVSISLTRPLGDARPGGQDAQNPSVTVHGHFLNVRDFDVAPLATHNGISLTTEVTALEDFAKSILDVLALARAGGVIPAEVTS